ncbi:6616_t:CDS:2, partial [Scutellospora calospora]
WIGRFEKGQSKKLLATVLLKPYSGHYHDASSILKTIGRTLWMRHFIPLSYAKELILPVDNIMPQFTIEAIYDKDISKIYIECSLMEWSEKVGIVWNETMTSFYMILPNSESICLKIGCLTRPTAPFFAISKNLSHFPPKLHFEKTLEYKQIFNNEQLMLDGFMEAESFLNLMRYYKLVEWFKNNPKFMDFSIEDNFERSEFLNAAKCLGGILSKEFCVDIEYVFIHTKSVSKFNYIPYLMKLKDLPNCKFIAYGSDPWPSNPSVDLEELLLH